MMRMVTPLTEKEQSSFEAYLRACTDAQVYGCLVRELKAERLWFAALAEFELGRRHMSAERHDH